MGAWGEKRFEDDDAMDFLGDLATPQVPSDLAPLAAPAIEGLEEAGDLDAFKRELLAIREHLA